MKTIIRIFLMSIFCISAFSANAQIKNTILGSTLGKSTEQTVLQMVQTKGYVYTKTTQTITCNDVNFAGYGWEKVVFYFYKNTLYKVEFKDPYVPSEKHIKSYNRPTKKYDIMSTISEAIKKKYVEFDSGFGTYKDGVTKLELSFGFTMTYEDIKLAKKLTEDSMEDI